jgi:hypothetical protein
MPGELRKYVNEQHEKAMKKPIVKEDVARNSGC